MKKAFTVFLAVCILVYPTFQVFAGPYDNYPDPTPIGYNLRQMQALDAYRNVVSGDIFTDYDLTLINVWAVWSGGGTYTLESMNALYDYYQQRNINMMCIYYELENYPIIVGENYLRENGYPFINVRDTYSEHINELFRLTRISALPVIYLVDGEGTVISYTTGYVTQYEMQQFINSYRDDMHRVTFMDTVSNSPIYETLVEHGGSTFLPNVPLHDGYVFEKWSDKVSYITENTVIYAYYKKRGDANCDGVLTTGDSTYILQHISGQRSLAGLENETADANADGTINTGDVVYVLRYVISSL